LNVSDIAQPALSARPNPARDLAFRLFERGRSVDQVAVVIGRATATAAEYLAEYVADRAPADVSAWVNRETYERILRAATETGGERLKPIFDSLNGEVPYGEIKVVLSHLQATDRAVAGATAG